MINDVDAFIYLLALCMFLVKKNSIQVFCLFFKWIISFFCYYEFLMYFNLIIYVACKYLLLFLTFSFCKLFLLLCKKFLVQCSASCLFIFPFVVVLLESYPPQKISETHAQGLFLDFFFNCCSSTVVSIFLLPIPPTTAIPTSLP